MRTYGGVHRQSGLGAVFKPGSAFIYCSDFHLFPTMTTASSRSDLSLTSLFLPNESPSLWLTGTGKLAFIEAVVAYISDTVMVPGGDSCF